MSYLKGKRFGFMTRQSVYSSILVGFSFMVLTFLIVKTLAPEINTEAAPQTASQTVGPYTMSMANDSVASINITPTATQAVYTVTNNISVTNTCTAGAAITMTTNSTTSNSLVRTGSDSLIKEIAATTTSSLDSNSWGFSNNSGSTYAAVPKKGQTAAIVYDESVARTSAYSVPVMFGVKTDNSMPSGAYTNDVVYTMTPKTGCLTYAVTWNMNGGTAKSGATYPTSLSWGQTIDLSTLTPTRDGYTFTGWSDGSSNYTGNSNINTTNKKTVTLTAQWTPACASGITCESLNLATNGVKNIAYSGTAKGFILNKTGRYKFEVWGASGGDTTSSAISLSAKGGRGAYASGVITLTEPTTFYAYVGGAGSATAAGKAQAVVGGWNGGGETGGQECCVRSYGSGGGASDFRFLPGDWNDATSLRSRIIVAAGGGGSYTGQNDVNANNAGGNGGKITGFNGTQSGGDIDRWYCFGTGASQTAGGTATDNCRSVSAQNYHNKPSTTGLFGYAVSNGIYSSSTGGGGGWYGGGRSGHIASAGGGSSYISGYAGFIGVTSKTNTTPKCASGSSTVACSLSWTGYSFSSVAMLGGNESMTAPSGASETGHTGNGYARITYLGV